MAPVGVSDQAILNMLQRLTAAAEQLGKMPHRGEIADVHQKLAQLLEQAENL
ncbi:MAG: hypothetical protein WBZ42_02230 [Halobacteriota archaeon]